MSGRAGHQQIKVVQVNNDGGGGRGFQWERRFTVTFHRDKQLRQQQRLVCGSLVVKICGVGQH